MFYFTGYLLCDFSYKFLQKYEKYINGNNFNYFNYFIDNKMKDAMIKK